MSPYRRPKTSSTGTSSASIAVWTNHRCPNGSRIVPPRAPYDSAIGRRSSRANAGRGASGTTGSRNVSNGSVIAPPFVVARSERAAGAYEQCFGRVHRAIEVVGDLGDRKTVEVPQRECRAVVRTELREHLAGTHAIEMRVDVVVDHVVL